jgi:hypothetical protein
MLRPPGTLSATAPRMNTENTRAAGIARLMVSNFEETRMTKEPTRRRGRPLVADVDSERCQALTVMTEWKKANKREERCPFVSRYSVQGKEFCRHHAVMEAMAICVERGDVSRIPRPPRSPGMRVPTVRGRGKS